MNGPLDAGATAYGVWSVSYYPPGLSWMASIKPRSTYSVHPLNEVAWDGVPKPVLKKGTTIPPVTAVWIWAAKTGAVRPATVTSQHTSLWPGFNVTRAVPLPWPPSTVENGSPPSSKPESRSAAPPAEIRHPPTTNHDTKRT